jgi:M6 family metalloprotease-like protein
MKKYYYLLVSLGMLLLFPTIVLSVPAYPGLVKITQPNREEVSVYLRGDEKVHWMESPDGYSLLYGDDKYIVYATTDEAGNMISSPVVFRNSELRLSATDNALTGIRKNLRYSASQINMLKEIWNFANRSIEDASLRATTGTIRAICALVDFPDKSFKKTKEEFEQLLNQTGYNLGGAKGSVRDFYSENSYGKMELEITVVGPYTAENNLGYYGDPVGNASDNYSHISELAKSVAAYAFSQPGIDPADYDNDNNDYIDAFHFIYAGFGEEAGGGTGAIWAHESGIYPAISIGSKRLNVYSCSPELRGNIGTGITHIGVICHEMGHVFGAPDFYDADGDTGGSFTGTGNWDLMAGGSWNNSGASPAHINMYQKIQLGWVNPVTLDAPQTITNMPNSAENATAYIYNTSVQGEYYVLENRQKKGFDAYVPGPGLLIYHVSVENRDISSNRVNSTHPQKMYPVCASSTYQTPDTRPASYGNINTAGCPFPGTSRKTAFTDYTTPSAITWTGTHSSKPITGITESNGMISFKFMQPDAEPVNGFSLTRDENNVQLSWNKPNDNVSGYNILRNNQLIIKLMGANNTSYTQYNVSPGDYSYCATAYYEQDESSPSCQSIRIEGNPNEHPGVRNLRATTSDERTVELTWDSPVESDWIFLTDDLSQVVSYKTTNFSTVVRFTIDDLKNFVGSQLSQVRFYVYNTACKHTIQVWHPSELPDVTPIISQPVTNSTTGIKVVDLNTPLTIEAGKELWIGINYEMTPMAPVAASDQGPKIPNKNFIIIEGEWYDTSNNDDFNWYIAGYLQLDGNGKYSVYRNNVWLNDVTTGSYRDDPAPSGNHIYCVSAVYGDQESERACVNTPVRTGIADLYSDEISAYPNPIKRGEVLTLNLGNDFAHAKVSFYSVSGELLQETTVSGPVYRQKVDLPPGIYILQISENKRIINRKIVVK